ncbi:MAG: DEAD/DEAH box helicase, partial [Clostridia bacterium]
MEFSEPTPIQAEVIPYVLQGLDCLAQAPTGTGKTCAFGIPLIDKIDEENSAVQTLIMCPTRELAKQTENELRKLLKYLEGIKVLAIYGGAPFQRQLAALKKRPQIVVGTPGRILDHLNRKTLRLRGVNLVVLDEADEMLNMGFRDDMDSILQEVSPDAQKIFFSATMPKEILEISRNYQTNPISVKTTCKESDLPEIKQYYIRVKEGNKIEAFDRIMREQEIKCSLVFCNTKRRVDEVEKKLNALGYRARGLHGDLRQSRRDYVMMGFRQKEFDVLVATDVAARGIDVDDIEAIFNYDLPLDDEYYIHRIGRTARANKKGVAYSFASAKDIHRVSECEKYINSKMQELELNGLTDVELATKKSRLVTTNSTRIFSNVGNKDNPSAPEFEKFVCDFAKISKSEILEIKLLDTYSFLEVTSEVASKIIALTGMNYGRRKVVFEVASPKTNGANASRGRSNSGRTSGQDERKSSRNGNDRSFGGKEKRSDFNKFKDKQPRSNWNMGNDSDDTETRADRPYEERKPRADRPYEERKPRADRPYEERKPRADRP